MYELSRVRLHAVGPKGARYQDVTLDLRRGDSGEPSPASVLFLANGGGKTVLVRLIFSVLLPGRRQVVGTSSSKVLEKFVLAEDVAHVALEWRDTRTGQLLVTGKVSEWSGHVVSADSSRLNERWYTLRPTDTLGLAALPFTQEGRIVSLSGFFDRLDEAQKTDPSLQVTWEKNHGDWTEHLQRLHLDPALFGYQRRMNAGEGEAADAFTFKTDEAFVDWLLKAILPEEEPAGLGDVVGEYGAQLASRGELMTERAFVEGTLERLGPLVRAAGEKDAAAAMHRDAQADVERLVLGLTGREKQEAARLSLLTTELGQVEASERLLDQKERRLNRITLELRRLVAKLRWDEAAAERGQTERDRSVTKDLLAAWQAIDVLVRHSSARQQAETVREIVRRAESEAAPLLSARNEAAQRFARKLLAVARHANELASDAERRAGELEASIRQASERRDQAIREAEGAGARIEQLTALIAAAQAAIQEAVIEGLLSDRENVSGAADAARDVADAAETAVTDLLGEADELASQREEVTAELDRARTRADIAARAQEKLAEKYAEAEQTAAGLIASDRLSSLLGSAEIDLDSDAQLLIELLEQAVSDSANERDELGIARQRDQRVLDALGDGGFLPAADPVLEALDVLRAAGITAWTGWEYLARMPADERDQVVARHPSLVDGIVLNSRDDVGQATESLRDARLLPRTLIAVGTSASITDSACASPADIEFIVPPNPALFDEERAAVEREQTQTRQDERHVLLAQLNQSIDCDQRLRSRLQAWQAAFPPGFMTALSAEVSEATVSLREAQEQERALRETLDGMTTRERVIRGQLPGLRALAAESKRKADRIQALAEEAGRIPGWQTGIREARGTRSDADEEATREGERGEALGHRQRELHREADGHHRTATALRDELAEVAGGGSVTEVMPVLPDALEALRAGYRTASEAYQRAEVGAELRAREERLSKDEAIAGAAVAALDQRIREQASALLATPEGSDAAARAEARARTERRLESLDSDLTKAAENAARLESAYRTFQPQEQSLERYGKPADIPHGEQLIRQAASDWTNAQAEHNEVLARLETLNGELTATRDLVRDFSAVSESLGPPVSPWDQEDVSPFAGTADTARSRRDSVRDAVTQATELLVEATEVMRRAADALARHAADERFEKLATPVRRQLTTTERDRLPDLAGTWEAALRPRFRVLTDELEQIDEHRAAIIGRLQGMVQRALGRLKAAQRASRLPADLADWSNLEFLRISFTQPEDTVLAERLGQVLDEVTAAEPGKAAAKRDGMSILLSGVKAAVQPRGVRVEILKPDAVLRDERVRVGEIGDVFSGGQLLTTAIILYCAMAWLRAGERGHAQRQHAGVLFLDNPIGRASAGYLLELQLTVARKLGVQLVYTTGLFDTNALSVFPLIVRLRNDADLRAGMKYLQVDEMIRSQLPAVPDNDASIVTASRVFIRPGSPDETR